MNMGNEKGEKITSRDMIESASERVTFFYTDGEERFIKTEHEGNVVFINTNTSAFDEWYRSYCYESFDAIIQSSDVNLAREHFRMIARTKGEKVKMHRRVVKEGETIYYDLGWDDNRALKITKTKNSIVRLKKPRFLNGGTIAPQVTPDFDTSPAELKRLVEKHFNLSEKEDLILLPLFLVSCFWGTEIAHPLLQLYGLQGSAKSTSLRRIQSIVDPHKYDLYDMPKNEEDVALAVHSDYMCCFDNVSYISPNVSDLLCRNCTGGVQKKRKRFTDKEQSALKLKSIVCINGINQNIGRADLAERTLFIELKKIPHEQKVAERILKEEWEQDLPAFFGALCNLAQMVLRDKKKVVTKSPFRLTDFYDISVRAGRALGYQEKEVHAAMKLNAERAKKELANGNQIISIIVEFMRDREEYPQEGKECSVTQFLTELRLFASEELLIDSKRLPQAPQWLSNKMNSNREMLEGLGICDDIRDSKDKNRHVITLWHK